MTRRITLGSIATLLLLWLTSSAVGQTVVMGPDGKPEPLPRTLEECSAFEPLRPNLKLAGSARIKGHVADQATAPIGNSPIELRRFISATKQETVKKAFTDKDGRFDLGVIEKGDYRLLLSPHRGFKQPEELKCDGTNCVLEVILVVNPTDQVTAQCPIR